MDAEQEHAHVFGSYQKGYVGLSRLRLRGDDSTKKMRINSGTKRIKHHWAWEEELSFLPPKTSCHPCAVFHHSAGDASLASQPAARVRAQPLCLNEWKYSDGYSPVMKTFFLLKEWNCESTCTVVTCPLASVNALGGLPLHNCWQNRPRTVASWGVHSNIHS